MQRVMTTICPRGLCGLALALLLNVAAVAGAQTLSSPSGLSISNGLVSTGGGLLSSGGTVLYGASGQAAVGLSSNGGASLQHGVITLDGPAEPVPQLLVTIDGPAVTAVVLDSFHTYTTTVSNATGTVDYVWSFEPTGAKVFNPLPGENDPSLTIGPVSAADAGRYRVQVTDDIGSMTSPSTRLVIVAALPAMGTAMLGLMTVLVALSAALLLRNGRIGMKQN